MRRNEKEEDVTFDDINYKFRIGVIVSAFATVCHLVGKEKILLYFRKCKLALFCFGI